MKFIPRLISCTVDAGFKNTLGSRKICSYNRINNTVDTRTVFQKMVLISGMFL